MPVPEPITALTDTRVIDRILNRRIVGKTALMRILFPSSVHENLVTETTQVDVLVGTVGMAPFNKIGQKATIVGSLNGTSYTINTPFINIQRPLTASTDFAKRTALGQVFVSAGDNQYLQRVRDAIEKDVKFMDELVDNRLEWMAAFILRGQIEYSVEGQDSFIINSGKPAANTYTVSVLWDAGSALPLEDINGVRRLVSLKAGPLPNVAIAGQSAAAALRKMVEQGLIKPIATTSGVIATERVNLLGRYADDGLMHMGKFGDVDFFEYTGQYVHDTTGTLTDFIRTDYVEFLSNSSKSLAERQLKFGAILDMDLILRGQHITSRNLTSVPPKPDQDSYKGIMKTRPFPHLRRPDWQVSLKVV